MFLGLICLGVIQAVGSSSQLWQAIGVWERGFGHSLGIAVMSSDLCEVISGLMRNLCPPKKLYLSPELKVLGENKVAEIKFLFV